MNIAEAWFVDPQRTYDESIARIERSFANGVITGSEAGMARRVAEDCLRLGLEGRSNG